MVAKNYLVLAIHVIFLCACTALDFRPVAIESTQGWFGIFMNLLYSILF